MLFGRFELEVPGTAPSRQRPMRALTAFVFVGAASAFHIAAPARPRCAIVMEDKPPPPPAFTFVSDLEKKSEPRRTGKPKNAVQIQREKDKKFLAQQKSFAKRRKEISNRVNDEAFSASSASGAMDDAEPIPLLFIPVGLVGLAGFAYLIVGLLFG